MVQESGLFLADDYRITACFGFIKHFATKYQHLTRNNSAQDADAVHAAGSDSNAASGATSPALDAVPTTPASLKNAAGAAAAQKSAKSLSTRSSVDFIVPTGGVTVSTSFCDTRFTRSDLLLAFSFAFLVHRTSETWCEYNISHRNVIHSQTVNRQFEMQCFFGIFHTLDCMWIWRQFKFCTYILHFGF